MEDDGRVVPDIARSVDQHLWRPPIRSYTETVIYCVIPRELEGELFEQDGRRTTRTTRT